MPDETTRCDRLCLLTFRTCHAPLVADDGSTSHQKQTRTERISERERERERECEREREGARSACNVRTLTTT